MKAILSYIRLLVSLMTFYLARSVQAESREPALIIGVGQNTYVLGADPSHGVPKDMEKAKR